MGVGNFISNTYSLHCHHLNDSALRVGSCVSRFNISLIVWEKSQDSVHKSQLLKRKESRSGSNRGPSAYQPSALPLSHTGSHRTETLYLGVCCCTISGLRVRGDGYLSVCCSAISELGVRDDVHLNVCCNTISGL